MDLISRQKAKDAIDMALDRIDHVPTWVYDNLLNALNGVPSAQPRRGKWAGKGDSEGFGIFICDKCGKFAMMEYDFCPNCGADLRPQFEEPEINPCRGCEDYDGKGGCKTKGGCAGSRGDSE